MLSKGKVCWGGEHQLTHHSSSSSRITTMTSPSWNDSSSSLSASQSYNARQRVPWSYKNHKLPWRHTNIEFKSNLFHSRRCDVIFGRECRIRVARVLSSIQRSTVGSCGAMGRGTCCRTCCKCRSSVRTQTLHCSDRRCVDTWVTRHQWEALLRLRGDFRFTSTTKNKAHNFVV